MRGLEKEPSKRPATAREFVEDGTGSSRTVPATPREIPKVPTASQAAPSRFRRESSFPRTSPSGKSENRRDAVGPCHRTSAPGYAEQNPSFQRR